MFPVRRELVGKRFAYIHGNGRSGTRHRGSVSGLDQNWDALSWVTGTILASNVDGLDAQNESVFVKRVKVRSTHLISLHKAAFVIIKRSESSVFLARKWRLSDF